MLNYVLWNIDPEVFTLFGRGVRWYGILFAGAFFLGYLLLNKILLRKGMFQKEIDKLTFYLIGGCIIGLRLGHCLFYQPKYYLSNPIEILKIWEGGLASHGAAIGILIALYLFVKKSKRHYFWLLDRIVIVVLLIAPFIRIGNLMNSEIIGKETKASHAFIFANPVDQELTYRYNDYVEKTEITQTNRDTTVDNTLFRALNIDIFLKKNKLNKKNVYELIYDYFIPVLQGDEDLNSKVRIFNAKPPVSIKETPQYYKASMIIYGIPRHPSQIYEALAYLLFFGLFMLYYSKKGEKTREGFFLGMFLICVFGFRFFVEYYKAVQVSFEKVMTLNMGQWLSIPFVIIGIIMAWWSTKKEAT